MVRDGAEWVLYAATLAASLSALALFLPWAIERLRHPEIEMSWKYRIDGRMMGLAEWPPGEVLEVRPGEVLHVRFDLRNVGARTLERAMCMIGSPFPVADDADTRADGGSGHEVRHRNHRIGVDGHAWWLGHSVDAIPPGVGWFHPYKMEIPPGDCRDELRVRMECAVESSELNSSGSSLIPRIIRSGPLHLAPGDPWPPRGTKVPPKLTRRTAMPRGRIYCEAGSRSDCRDLVVKAS
jgi:hypothetical protein